MLLPTTNTITVFYKKPLFNIKKIRTSVYYYDLRMDILFCDLMMCTYIQAF